MGRAVNGWGIWLSFATGANTVLSLLKFLSDLLNRAKSGSSPAVPENVAPTTSISSPTLTVVIKRNRRTKDAIFGTVTVGGKFICYSMENLARAISPGIYTARLDMSPHLGYVCPHLQVPERDTLAGGDAGIRLHVANYPRQIEGCIALGLRAETDYLEHSQAAFYKLIALVPQARAFLVSVSE